MSNHSIMTALVISSLSVCGSVQAAEYQPSQVVPASKASGVMKASEGVYIERATGDRKDRSMPNSGQVTTTATANTPSDRAEVLTASGAGAAKAK